MIKGTNAIKLCIFLQAKSKLFVNGWRSKAAMSSIAGMDKVNLISSTLRQEIILHIYDVATNI